MVPTSPAEAVTTAVHRRSGWAFFLAGGLIAAVIYVTAPGPVVSALAFAAVGAGAGAAILTGIRRFRPRPRWPWVAFAIACGAFLVGALMRGVTEDATGYASLLADCFTIPGYLLLFAGLAGFLRARIGVKRHVVIDGLLVGVGVTVIFLILFGVPAASIPGREALVSAVAGFYPVIDGILVLLVLNLAFATGRRGPAYLLLLACMAVMVVGDIAYAVIGAEGELTGSPLLDLPFLIGFTFIGTAALHPSMVDIGHPSSLPIQAWSMRRLALIAPALAVAPVAGIVIAHPSLPVRIVLAAGGLLIVGLLLARAIAAVRGYAAAQRRHEYQATHDALTGLANRTLWFTRVREMLGQVPPEQQVWVYFLDLDGFKYVNDSRGHPAGDQVIMEVADRLRSCAPAAAAIARVGGDEFVVAHLADRDGALELADVILQTMRQTLRMPTADVAISVSIGIASSPGLAASAVAAGAEDLLRDADTAMYRAKANGRDGWAIFDPAMREKVQERIDIDLALREAMADDQLHLAFQPVVRLATGQVVGAEALLRWTHPTRGDVGPANFIPVAEDTGLILDIGRWVLHDALRQLAQWRASGAVSEDFWLSINVSARQLRDPRLPGELAAALATYGVPASVVVLELTESVMIDPLSPADEGLRALRALGVSLVVDDFGTGFSALGYLRSYPVTGVKIDRSFVVGLGRNPEDEAIVRAVVAMSGAMQLSVVAEGVQDEEQRRSLADMGVTLGQGWLWGKPVDAAAFTRRWSQVPDAALRA
ncbi:MAG: EAL domain-containing protein [Hamadaea sp.]|nr:EAL domain-containing protein [Hamadaea sp.]